MAVTSQIMSHTPLTGSGLSIPAANKQRYFAEWVEAKEVRNTPFTDWMGGKMSEPFNQIDIEVGQSYAPFITTTLGAQAANNSANLTVASTAYLREGDVLRITPYHNGSTTELNHAEAEQATVLSITNATVLVADRDNGETSSGSWPTHASGSEVRVIFRAQNYNEPFPDAITFRGDILVNHPERLDSGEITYDIAAIGTPDFESTRHFENDIQFWRNELLAQRDAMFMEGRKRTGDYTASPQIPYKTAGAIQWAEWGGTVEAVDGVLNLLTFDDVYREKADTHSDGPGTVAIAGYKTTAALDSILMQLKGNLGANETTLTNKFTKYTTRWGTLELMPMHKFPEGKILITSKGDFKWSNYVGMDWTYVKRGPEELGAFQRSWTMGGDFALVCTNVSRQILLTGIETRLDLYPGRQFMATL